MTPAEVRRAAVVEFGGIDQIQEDCREMENSFAMMNPGLIAAMTEAFWGDPTTWWGVGGYAAGQALDQLFGAGH